MKRNLNLGTIKVRLLDDLVVALADGTVVGASVWRTGKTMDLLRMLAINVERPLRTETVIERLWPDADRERGRGSLRTAVSEIRRTLGDKERLVRVHDSLVLTGVWVDVAAFETVAARVRALRQAERHQEGMRAAFEGTELYRGDLHAYDDDHPWICTERDRLQLLHQDFLTDAAECALACGCHREAWKLATSVLQLEPTSEVAVRTAMAALAGLGDTARGLRVYEEFRRSLVEELGVDPSSRTQEMHLQLLRGEDPSGPDRLEQG